MAKLSDKQAQQNKTDKIMQIVAKRCAYYRANPHRFASEFLGITNLKLFQKILLYAMQMSDAFYFIATRGIGKTYLVALYSVMRCILYPGTKIITCSHTFKQGKEIFLKITDDFMLRSPLLRNEISKVSMGQNECAIYFKNKSWMRLVTANENSRGARANCIIIDESRMVDQHIVDTVLRPMNSSPRQPGYLSKPQYAHLAEMNKEMYMSSAWYSASEMYEKVKSYTSNMLNPNYKYFVCDLPYQLSIREGLLMREQIELEMSESTFSDITFSMERGGLFYGSADDALFDFNTLTKRRVIESGLHCLEYYRDNNLRVPEKQPGELRILAVDVALLASKKHDNDASALTIHSAIPTESHNYIDNIVYVDTQEGLVTDDLGLLVMRYYYQYDCDYIAIDMNGVGQSVGDYLMADRYDPVYGKAYGALNVCNAPELEDRCKVVNAPKVIYCIKASGKFNNDIVLNLRAGFQNGYINLLLPDVDGEDRVQKMRGYSKQTEAMQAKLLLPYVQTTLLINELINLTYDTSNGLVKVKERYGMRKDRYSSIAYGYYVVQELSRSLKPETTAAQDILNMFSIKTAKKRNY